MSIGMACNFYREPHALAGLLESSAAFFDDLFFIHACPAGGEVDEEGIALLEKWDASWIHESMEEGFGVIRSKLIHGSSTEWVMILDCDERFYAHDPVSGFDQGGQLRTLTAGAGPEMRAIRSCRRHWRDFSFTKPVQDVNKIADMQLRIVRNLPSVGYKPAIAMHEQLLDTETGKTPIFQQHHTSGDAPFHDHFHEWFKPMEPEQRAQDVETYNRIYEAHKK